jgi:hypothetical protein
MLTGALRETSKAVTTDLLHPCNVGEQGLCCCQMSRVKKKLGSNTLNSNSRGNRWNGTACFSQRKRNSRVCRQNEKSWLQLSGIRKVLFLWPFQSNTSELWPLHFSTTKSKCLPSRSASHEESQNSCFSMPPDHTPVRPAQNFHGECSHIHSTVLTPQIIYSHG